MLQMDFFCFLCSRPRGFLASNLSQSTQLIKYPLLLDCSKWEQEKRDGDKGSKEQIEGHKLSEESSIAKFRLDPAQRKKRRMRCSWLSIAYK